MPLALWQGWVWLDWKWPITVEWVGVQKIIIWIFDCSLSFSLLVIGGLAHFVAEGLKAFGYNLLISERRGKLRAGH
jgi:hypothetical protein